MKLSNSVALSILFALSSVNALVIPNFEDLPAQFNLVKDVTVPVEADMALATPKSLQSSNIELLSEEDSAPLIGMESFIPNSYIIMFKDGMSKDASEFHQLWVQDLVSQSLSSLSTPGQVSEFSIENGGGIKHVFDIGGVTLGYSGKFTPSVVKMLLRNPDVAVVEMDSVVHSNDATTQVGAPWGLSRISHREQLGLSNFNQYLYDDVAGTGVTAYIIDTGVSITHQEFEGRAKWGATIPDGDEDVDGNGHGTHCAGTIGSKSYGVSKNASLVAIKVLRSNGSGTMSDVVKGVEVAANMHIAESKASKKGFKGSTANMSLGGGKSPALDLAVNAAVKAGIHFSVAAGNENQDACNTSPAAAEKPVTVGASTLSDTRAYFSNYGKCVDIFAPGLNVLSTYIGSETATAVLSGTSMASPHVCGLMTYFLSLQPEADSLFSSSAITPDEMKANLIKFGTKDALSSIPDEETPNVLIFNGAGKDLSDFWNYTGSEPESSRAAEILEETLEKIDVPESLFNDVVAVVEDIKNLVN